MRSDVVVAADAAAETATKVQCTSDKETLNCVELRESPIRR